MSIILLDGSDQKIQLKVSKYQSEEEKSPSYFICTKSGFMPYIPCNAGVAYLAYTSPPTAGSMVLYTGGSES